MLSIRFTRIGRKKAPLYRIVIMDKRKDPWANFIEKLGFYNPRTKETKLEKERIEYWLKQGAKASETVHNLFIKNGIISADKAKSVKITKKRSEKINREKQEKVKAEADKLAAEEAKKAENAKPEEVVETPVEETPTQEAPKTE